MFKIVQSRPQAQTPYVKYNATDDEAIAIGEVLVLTSGALTKCAATGTPEYIAVGAVASASSGEEVTVYRVDEDMIFETVFSADGSSLTVGQAVTIDSTGLKVTATTTSGVFEITKIIGDGTAGTKVQGMFRR